MLTTCPNCTLNLALTTNDLRVGQGYVRCGRCGRVFNALISLTEEQGQQDASGVTANGTELHPEPKEPEVDGVPKAEADEFPLFDGPPDGVKVVEHRSTGTFETIVLEGDSVTQTEEQVDQAEVDQQLQRIADRIDADELAHVREALRLESLDESGTDFEGDAEDASGYEGGLGIDSFGGDVENVVMETSTSPEMDADAVVGYPRRTHWVWTATAAMAALLLLIQIVHHSRQMLVTQTWAQPTLTAVYALFGVALEPNWDLAAYDLRQLGGETLPDAASRIVIHATVHNRAEHAQPVPIIRVRLQDRFGNALASRAISPQDYMRGEVPSRLKPDQRIDAELIVEDPNRQAVGFELDACLPDAGRQLHCSNDL